ncbi:glutamate--cysteine ligase, partial [Halobium palmae]
PVQLRDSFGTVEWRSPDAALPSQALRLADTVADLVGHLDGVDVRIEGKTGEITDDAVVLPEFDAVVEYVDAAIEDGLESEAVRSYLDRMGFDVDAFEPVSHEIDGRESISTEEARELRLEHAERVKHDVRRARSIRSD